MGGRGRGKGGKGTGSKGKGRKGRGEEGQEWEGDSFGPRPGPPTFCGSTPMVRTDQIKDLGILLDEGVSFRDHINDKINKPYSMLGIIKRNFKHLTIQSFTMLYKTW